jgi:hypothetical protein
MFVISRRTGFSFEQSDARFQKGYSHFFRTFSVSLSQLRSDCIILSDKRKIYGKKEIFFFLLMETHLCGDFEKKNQLLTKQPAANKQPLCQKVGRRKLTQPP